VSRADSLPPALRHGFYTGWIGIAHVLLEASEHLERPDWAAKAWQLIDGVCGTEPDPSAVDVLGGIASAIRSLIRLYERAFSGQQRRQELLDHAVRFGESLLARVNKSDHGWSWTTMPPMIPGAPDLTGFSHGTGGIGWTMLELHRATGRDDFRQAGIEAIRYEQTWFQPDSENWPGFRNEPTPSHKTKRFAMPVPWRGATELPASVWRA
jgi:lantibiotic modifying enzyme